MNTNNILYTSSSQAKHEYTFPFITYSMADIASITVDYYTVILILAVGGTELVAETGRRAEQQGHGTGREVE